MKDAFQLVIPMTGIGQRFVDKGYKQVKPLIETGMGSMLSGVLSNFKKIQSPIFIISNTHPQRNDLRKEIYSLRPKSKIYEIAAHKLGPSFAVWCIREYLNPELPTVINYCDFSGKWSEDELRYRCKEQDGLILTYTGFHPHRIRNNNFAYVKKNNLNLVCDIQEKQSFTNNPNEEEASTGTYVFKNAEILINSIKLQMQFDYSYGGEFYTSLSYKPMIENGMVIKTMLVDKYFQWGTPEDLQDFKFWHDLTQENSIRELKITKTNGLILAAGAGSRLKETTKETKPLISVFGKPLWNFSSSVIRSCQNKYVFIRQFDQEKFINSSNIGIQYLTTVSQTRSQAESALKAIEMIPNKEIPIHILACDNIIKDIDLDKILNLIKKYKIVVWVSSDYPIANTKPEEFTWVETNSEGDVKNIYVKEKSPPKAASIVIGNFTFATTNFAEELVTQILGEKYVSNEIYLDYVIQCCINSKIAVTTLNIGKFSAVGTQVENQILEYWHQAFHEDESF
jgi:dTDP-glucose pyrophosphorylase